MRTGLKRTLRQSLWCVAAFGLAAGPGVLPAEPEIVQQAPYDTQAPYESTSPYPAAPAPDSYATPAPDTASQAPLPGGEVHYYSDPELEDMVSRIALYPDDLIAIILPAATYPLQVVEAERLLQRTESGGNPQPDPNWDSSVVALLNYPDVVKLMNDNLDWMSRLGEASVNQRTDVLAAVSRFRDRAYSAGNLRSDDRQTVTRSDEAIEIAPANPEVIYVPYYEPARVVVYQPEPVFWYYPRPCPVYYYAYPANYWYRPYRPYWQPYWPRHFWGVNIVFNIGWHSHDVFVHDHGHVRPPHWGPCRDPWRRRPWQNDGNRGNGHDDQWRGREDAVVAHASPKPNAHAQTNAQPPDRRQTPHSPTRAQANSLVAANGAQDLTGTRGDKGKTVVARGQPSRTTTTQGTNHALSPTQDSDDRGPRRNVQPVSKPAPAKANPTVPQPTNQFAPRPQNQFAPQPANQFAASTRTTQPVQTRTAQPVQTRGSQPIRVADNDARFDRADTYARPQPAPPASTSARYQPPVSTGTRYQPPPTASARYEPPPSSGTRYQAAPQPARSTSRSAEPVHSAPAPQARSSAPPPSHQAASGSSRGGSGGSSSSGGQGSSHGGSGSSHASANRK